MLTAVSGAFDLNSEPSVAPLEFTLKCNSFGGPATIVEWLLDGVPVQEDSNHITNKIIWRTSTNPNYINTLRVRGRPPGTYSCTVSNNINDFFPGTRTTVSYSFRLQSEYRIFFFTI